jgi:tRNA-2-methylthio-N6-dimethylallyladenosine synthase
LQANIVSNLIILKLTTTNTDSTNGSVYIETYGCQMNLNDSEVIASILTANGYHIASDLADADVVLINTCSIRENAETRVWGRLDVFRLQKKKKPSRQAA